MNAFEDSKEGNRMNPNPRDSPAQRQKEIDNPATQVDDILVCLSRMTRTSSSCVTLHACFNSRVTCDMQMLGA